MSIATAVPRPIVQVPPAPTTQAESGLSVDLLTQLVLKVLHLGGEQSGTELGRRLGLRYSVIEPALGLLKSQQQCEVIRGSMLGGASFLYRLTDAGRVRAGVCLEQNHYVGVAPVPLAQYRAYLEAYARAVPRTVSRERVRDAFSELVLSEHVLDQLGPAINSGHSLFVYGPPGNGKSVISQAIRHLLNGEIAVPHAIEVEGQIVRLFDPVNHEPVEPDRRNEGLDRGPGEDERWVRCRRPLITVGGELTLDALELNYSTTAGFYRAPVQLLATGGVLVIDDFGRQHCSPRDLLNRWIVPLETRVDYLTLETGAKFDLPFLVLVVFATNINPTELVDEAFLRRIHYKVYAEGPTREQFIEIFARCCRARDLDFDPALVFALLEEWYKPRGYALRGCHPRDLIDHAISLVDYLDLPRRLTLDLLLSACAGYFVDEPDDRPGATRASHA